MKRLRKIRLINWHYYANETIEIAGNTLVTGENGAGKSTVLDSIQFVLSPGKQKFNIAANDGTKRTLNAYVRGKLGKSTQKYLREGDVTCHISLEFIDTNTDKTFVVGAVIDSQDTISSPKTIFYDFEGTSIDELSFLSEDNVPLNIKEFRTASKKLKGTCKVATSQGQARKNIAFRFNITDYKFFDILPKALAFKPINNVKDFIYSYILDEKELDIQYLIGNIKTYKEYIKMLETINDKITRLERIDKVYKEILNIDEQRKISTYVYKKAQLESITEKITSNHSVRESLENQLNMLKEEVRVLREEHKDKKTKRDELHVSLLVNDEYKLLDRLRANRDELQTKIDSLNSSSRKLDQTLAKEYNKAKELKSKGYSSIELDEFLAYQSMDFDVKIVNDLQSTVSDYLKYVTNQHSQLNSELAMENMRLSDLESKLRILSNDVKTLSQKKIIIPKDAINFKEELKRELAKRYNISTTPVILCEVLEVKDHEWQNAIEGYLGKARFNVLVNPDYFDKALLIYKEVRRKYKSGVALVNTKQLKKYDKENAGGLSEEVTSTYAHAKNYINYRFNNVMKVDDVTELEKHNVAVTRDCVLYQGYVVSDINVNNYKIHYIGSNAYKKQMDDAKRDFKVMSEQYNETRSKVSELKEISALFNADGLNFIKSRCNVKVELFSRIESLESLDEQIDSLQDGATLTDKQALIDKIEVEVTNLDTKISDLQNNISVTNHKLTNLESVEELHFKVNEHKKELETFENDIISLLSDAKAEFDSLFKSKKSTAQQIENKSKRQLDKHDKTYYEKVNNLIVSQKYYNLTFEFDAEEGVQGMDRFYEEYHKLKNSQLVQYEEKVHESKQRSEEELKEHFVYRLHESLHEAHRHFDDLNESLDGILFGKDQYSFQIKPNPTYREFYEMLMSSVAASSNKKAGFSDEFLTEHGDSLNKLVDYIISDKVNEKLLEEIVDYRTFMDYDICIDHGDGGISLLSDISREKSGGETQIPYYVAMAATFIKIYQSNSVNSDSMGIVLFDEAFDKMDSTRTEAMMTFLKNLGMQVILSAPPQKVEDIFPYTESTIIVTKEDQYSWTYSLNKDAMLKDPEKLSK